MAKRTKAGKVKRAKPPVRVKRPRGLALLIAAVNQIVEHPKTWNQSQWHCGSSHCVGGWAELIGFGEGTNRPFDRVVKAIRIDHNELARNAFAIYLTLPQIHAYVTSKIAAHTGPKLPKLLPLPAKGITQ